MFDLEEKLAFVDVCVHTPGRKLVLASTSGYGFVVPEEETVAMTRRASRS